MEQRKCGRKEKQKEKREAHLNLDWAFADIEILRVDLIPPFLFPKELGSHIRPETSRILNGPFVNLQVLKMERLVRIRFNV